MFREKSSEIFDLLQSNVSELKKVVNELPHQFVNTQNDDKKRDYIWGSVYYETEGEYREVQVKAIAILQDELCVLVDDQLILYTEDDMLQDNDNWYSLENTMSDLGYVHTLFNILEIIDEYLD